MRQIYKFIYITQVGNIHYYYLLKIDHIHSRQLFHYISHYTIYDPIANHFIGYACSILLHAATC